MGISLWVMGPAFAFDADARRAMEAMVENGYVDGLMAGKCPWLPMIWKGPCSIQLWDRIFILRSPIQTVITIIWM